MKNSMKRALCLLLTLCLVFSLMPMKASAALDSRVEKAISWAISIANDNRHGYSQTNRYGPDYDCSSFVSAAFKQGGFKVSETNWTGSMEKDFTSVGFKAYNASSVTLQRGDILLRHDNVKQHVELYIGNNQCVAAHDDDDGKEGDSGGHEIEVRSKAYCEFCNYKQYTRILRYEGKKQELKIEYFDCNVEIQTKKGKRVNLYTNPTDSNYNDYYDRGGSLYSTYGAKLSDGSTWYRVRMSQSGKEVDLWLNAKSNGVKIINIENKIEPSLSFSPNSLSVDVGTNKTISVNYKGDNAYLPAFIINNDSICSASWGDVDMNAGKAALIVTGKTAGSTSIKINLVDSNRKILCTKSFDVTVNGNTSAEEPTVPNSISFSSKPRTVYIGDSKTITVNFEGTGIENLRCSCSPDSFCDVNWSGGIDMRNGRANLKIIGKRAGGVILKVEFLDKSGNAFYSDFFSFEIKEQTYTVSYDANGGSGAPSSQTKQHDKTLTLSSVKPTWDGYSFKGWATSSWTSSAQYQPGSSYTSNEDLTLYAVWERNRTESSITFSTNNLTLEPGSSKTVSVRFKGDGIKSLGFEPNDYENSVCRLNWSNIDWENGTTSVTVTGKKAGTVPITVHFLDKYDNSFFSESFSVTVNNASYTVSYDANGGNGAPGAQTKDHGKSINLSVQKPTRSGYKFSGWATSSNAANADYQPGSTYDGNSNLTLYAVWTPESEQGYEIHFKKQTVYFQGQFTDVDANQWFTNNVAEAYELGLMNGNSPNTFNPYGDVTLAEAITLACRIHSIYLNGYENISGSSGKWYQKYLDYAYENEIISWAYYNANVENKATRAQFVEILSRSLPDEGFYAINTIQDNAIPDVPSSEKYAPYVYKLYRAGILTGGDATGTFSPQTYITRAEAAAVISRLAESDNRIQFSLQ